MMSLLVLRRFIMTIPKILIIAEKPDMGRNIAAAIDPKAKLVQREQQEQREQQVQLEEY
jgi:hypothetical protein